MTYPTVHAVDVGDLCAIQSAAMSSSARVLDAHTLEELQSLTRVWEDGADGRRAGLCPLAVAVHDMADYLATASTLSAGEAVSAHAWVESQTFLQVHYESHGSEDGLGLRAVVGGDDYRAFSTSACEVSVLQRDNCYVLTLRHCADALDIALPIFDLGSIPWFMQWSARGHCTLTLQSLLSGRVTVLTVAWPAGFKGPVVPEFAPPAADEAARADQEYRTLFGNECAI
jgi:hypothetical protein